MSTNFVTSNTSQERTKMPERSIGYNVSLIPQTTVMGCWAAGTAMIRGWRDHISIDQSTIARNPGGAPYLSQLQTGLDPNDIHILRRWGLVVESPQSYTVEGFAQLLERHGPLWVAARLPIIPAHIRVVTGMEVAANPNVARVYINDPWEEGMRIFRWPNRGARYSRTYTQFVAEVENLARAEMRESAPVYVAHLP
jgi:Papain-like cysteine protease AvrRpt2